MTNDPKILGLAFIAGVVPSLFWLWFWLKEDQKNPEPKTALGAVFLMGVLSVALVIPVQKFIQTHIGTLEWQLFFWATAEEIIKYCAVMLVIYKTNLADEPVDWPIYMITGALGFAAIENALFMIKPFSAGAAAVGLLTGQLRFLGATLLHTVTSGLVGIALGISTHLRGFRKNWYLFSGILLAIFLHSVFNFFIIRNDGGDIFTVFAFLWVVAIIVMLLFEKVRRMN